MNMNFVNPKRNIYSSFFVMNYNLNFKKNVLQAPFGLWPIPTARTDNLQYGITKHMP